VKGRDGDLIRKKRPCRGDREKRCLTVAKRRVFRRHGRREGKKKKMENFACAGKGEENHLFLGLDRRMS